MKRFSVFLFVAITFNVALGMTIRQKRQTNVNENALDNKYGGYDRGDRWIWPNQERQPNPRPITSKPMPTTQWLQPNQAINLIQTTTTTPAPIRNGSTTQTPQIQQCIRNCLVTSEYNPVCGTNMAQFNNIGNLECARSCGVDVTLLRQGRCPPTTTLAPTS